MRGIYPNHLREVVIRPALELIGMHSQAAEDLLLATALQESAGGHYLCQLDSGPAIGIFQMEPATYHDHWLNFIRHRPALQTLLWGRFNGQPAAKRMATDLLLAAVMCRIHYFRVAEPLPQTGDIQAMANYWKKYYNTSLGKGTTADFIHNWQKTQ